MYSTITHTNVFNHTHTEMYSIIHMYTRTFPNKCIQSYNKHTHSQPKEDLKYTHTCNPKPITHTNVFNHTHTEMYSIIHTQKCIQSYTHIHVFNHTHTHTNVLNHTHIHVFNHTHIYGTY